VLVVLVVEELVWAEVEVVVVLCTCVDGVAIFDVLGILLEIIFTNTKLDFVFELALALADA
jgi:hypothetical protein